MEKKSLAKLEFYLRKKADQSKAKTLSRYFKTGKGEYGEGDVFLGIRVPDLRALAKDFTELSFADLQKLLNSKWHEFRLISLIILVEKYKKEESGEQEKIVNFYLKNIKNINNWDLVDLSSYHILGAFFYKKDRSLLYELARSKNIWARRIAIVSTYYFIKQGDLQDTFNLAQILLKDQHDLMHKAVGWMLREAGKVKQTELKSFLLKNKKDINRTTWRYAIERFSPSDKKKFMSI